MKPSVAHIMITTHNKRGVLSVNCISSKTTKSDASRMKIYHQYDVAFQSQYYGCDWRNYFIPDSIFTLYCSSKNNASKFLGSFQKLGWIPEEATAQVELLSFQQPNTLFNPSLISSRIWNNPSWSIAAKLLLRWFRNWAACLVASHISLSVIPNSLRMRRRSMGVNFLSVMSEDRKIERWDSYSSIGCGSSLLYFQPSWRERERATYVARWIPCTDWNCKSQEVQKTYCSPQWVHQISHQDDGQP